MPFRSRLGTQIHSVKHVVDSNGALTGTIQSFSVVGNAVVVRNAVFNPTEIVVGETINAFFIELFILGATGSTPTQPQEWYIAKIRGGQTTADLPAANEVGTSELRNQIFHMEKGLTASGDGTPMVFKGVIVVPRSMRRTREGDQFVIGIRNLDATVDSNFCILTIYKSFS